MNRKSLDCMIQGERMPRRDIIVINGSGLNLDPYSMEYKNRNAITTSLGENR